MLDAWRKRRGHDRTWSFATPLPHDEVARRIVRIRAGEWDLGGVTSGGGYEGRVERDAFEFSRWAGQRNTFPLCVSGRIDVHGDATVVTARIWVKEQRWMVLRVLSVLAGVSAVFIPFAPRQPGFYMLPGLLALYVLLLPITLLVDVVHSILPDSSLESDAIYFARRAFEEALGVKGVSID